MDEAILASVTDGVEDEDESIRILIEIPDGLTEALCAEPAIRSLKTRFDMRSKVTVCSIHGDLYRNHPAVDCFGCIDPTLETSEYAQIFRLDGRKAADQKAHNLIDHYADQLGVDVMERRPWICLDSFDTTRIQRFRMNELPCPRIALALGEENSGNRNWDGYEILCRRIVEEVTGSIVQIGESHWIAQQVGINLLGRLTAREAGAVLMDCDLLICTDNGYLDLAAAVHTPVVALLDSQTASYRMDSTWGTFISHESEDPIPTKSIQDRIIQNARNTCKVGKYRG
jgi:ADP-heptose:LPS heptosyltransferase